MKFKTVNNFDQNVVFETSGKLLVVVYYYECWKFKCIKNARKGQALFKTSNSHIMLIQDYFSLWARDVIPFAIYVPIMIYVNYVSVDSDMR